MKVISIDPGYERLGIAVLEKKDGEKLLFSECFKTGKKLLFNERLLKIGQKLEEIIEQYQPKLMAIETLLFNTNQKTAMHVAETRGVILYFAGKYKMSVREFSPSQVKAAILGYGRGDKSQMMKMIPKLIKTDKDIKSDDEFDAIAVGLTCLATER